MTIGLAKAFSYYEYGTLWETFFKELGAFVVTSGNTCRDIFESGIRDSIDECCLPSKIYMGHVRSLLERCDYVLVPCYKKPSGGENVCIRLLGLYDVIKNTYKNARLLDYTVYENSEDEASEFLRLGKAIGKNAVQSHRAYMAALQAQKAENDRLYNVQSKLYESARPKIMISSRPYISHDPYIGKPVAAIISEQGGIPLFSDRCDRNKCLQNSKKIAPQLQWKANREAVGAVAAYRPFFDGAILLTAFPCGSDSLVNEMVIRKIYDVPIIQLLIDEQQSETGLMTRIESFMDILKERQKAHGA